MNSQNGHLTAGTMQDFIAGRLGSDDAAAARMHLTLCGRCAGRVRAYRAIEASLRSLPLEHADSVMTDRILERAGIADRKAYRYADVMAGTLAAVFVGGILLLVFGILGIVPVHTAIGDSSAVSAWWGDISQQISSSIGSFSSRLGVASVSISSITLGALSVGVIAVLLGLDHVIERWMARGNGAR